MFKHPYFRISSTSIINAGTAITSPIISIMVFPFISLNTHGLSVVFVPAGGIAPPFKPTRGGLPATN